ncbi:hypothetical protein SynA1840_02635 [Synechococcus sp. A18-40]|nr:hypothetical protein SynA1840_02635 [Synechococcus sp. A18-40]
MLNASSGSKQGQTPERVPLKKAPAFGGGFFIEQVSNKKPAPGDRLGFVEEVNRAGETSPKRIT